MGLLTSLPVLAFAAFGALAPAAARHRGVHRVTLVSLLAVVGRAVGPGHAQRGGVPGALDAGPGRDGDGQRADAVAGQAALPDRVGTVTAIYTTALAVGLTRRADLTVPIAETFGGWRVGLGTWAVLASSRRCPGSV